MLYPIPSPPPHDLLGLRVGDEVGGDEATVELKPN